MSDLRFVVALAMVIGISGGMFAETPSELYQRRVVPLLRSPEGSSCSECHMQGMKLSDFMNVDPRASFASLRARGWINTESPGESKLLEFIAKKNATSDPIHERVRRAELDAIGEWIRSACQDPESLNTQLPELRDLTLDEALIRHARKDQVLGRFVDVIWSQLERCANCHSPDRNAKQVEKNGASMSWIVPKSPGETLQLLENRKLIDLAEPGSSLIRAKALGHEDHGGGVKFPEDGHTDRQWSKFIEDYAAIKNRRYAASDQIPSMDSIATWRTGLHLKIQGLSQVPSGQFGVVAMHRIHRSDEGRQMEMVDPKPVAFGEGRVSNDGTSWGTTLCLLLSEGGDRTDSGTDEVTSREDGSLDWRDLLTDGKYQLRWVLVDDPSKSLEEILKLAPDSFIDIDGLWAAGHATAKSFLYTDFQRWESQRRSTGP